MKRFLSLFLVVFAVVICVTVMFHASAARAQQQYSLTPLGYLPGGQPVSGATGVNNLGHVVGHALNADGFFEAYIWDPVNGMTGLGDLPGHVFESRAMDINDSNEVVGYGMADIVGREAFLWDALNGMRGLGSLPGNLNSTAYGINNSGQIVGGHTSGEAFLWDAVNGMTGIGGLLSPPEGNAYDINEAGQVTGGSRSPSGFEAFLWDPVNGMTGLGDLPNGAFLSTGRSLNETGQVVGNGNARKGNEAFSWDAAGGMIGLGDFAGGDFESGARGVNGQGRIVGFSHSKDGLEAAIWDPVDGMSSLNDLLDGSGAGWRLTAAWDINESGQIVGSGTNPAGDPEAYLLTPVTETCDVFDEGLSTILRGLQIESKKNARRIGAPVGYYHIREYRQWDNTSNKSIVLEINTGYPLCGLYPNSCDEWVFSQWDSEYYDSSGRGAVVRDAHDNVLAFDIVFGACKDVVSATLNGIQVGLSTQTYTTGVLDTCGWSSEPAWSDPGCNP